MLATLQQHSPTVIGLDIYRDIPHSPGTDTLVEQLQASNIITITNLDTLGEVSVPSPLQVPQSRVGFNDFVLDHDGVVRRNFMFAAIGEQQLYSFSLRLVEYVLSKNGQTVRANLDGLRLSTAQIDRIEPGEGGYERADTLGYQTLTRYVPPEQVAEFLTLDQVLSGEFQPASITDKIVIIGTIAPSQKDLFYTPLSSANDQDVVMPGVVLHAQMTQQLLNIASAEQPTLRGWSQSAELAWLWLWSFSGGIVAFAFSRPLHRFSVAALCLSAGISTTVILFSQSIWVPLALPALTFGLTLSASIVYREFRKSFYDSVTGLPNRALITQELSHQLRQRPSLAVILVDVDQFRRFNESFGLWFGDWLLQTLSRQIRHQLPKRAKLARIAGDEFLILLPRLGSKLTAIDLAKQINQAVATPLAIDGQKIFPSASTGIAFSSEASPHPHAFLNAEDMLRNAQTAISRAKSKGRGQCEIFVQDMRDAVCDRLWIENDLREALTKGEFELYYQPIICLKSLTISGFEALIRWQHPTKGIVSPAEFIPIAEETGLIIPIGQWVLESACQQAARWQQLRQRSPVFVSINLSGRQFEQADLVEQIQTILFQSQCDPQQIKLELTESVIMDNVETSIDTLLELKALALKIGIDDFGTGYSSLSYLHRFPIDTLKVDRSFVTDMEIPNGTIELVKTIIALGHNLGMNVVAEGIETNHQARQLMAFNCEYGQGYRFAKPLSVDQAEALLLDPPDEWQTMM